MTRTPTGETPFRLTFKSEAVIQVEVGLTSYKIAHHDGGKNEEGICLQLDLLDEIRMMTEQRMEVY